LAEKGVALLNNCASDLARLEFYNVSISKYTKTCLVWNLKRYAGPQYCTATFTEKIYLCEAAAFFAIKLSFKNYSGSWWCIFIGTVISK
jgi:hypothetical protein